MSWIFFGTGSNHPFPSLAKEGNSVAAFDVALALQVNPPLDPPRRGVGSS